MTTTAEIRHFHLFAGLGGGARGFNRGEARVGRLQARFRCIGGIDSDAAAIADFGTLAGVQGTVLDLFDRPQYVAFHGKEPPADWREATPDDIRRAAGGERPHIIFTSPPCKGFSGLLSETRSKTDKYQALNRLTVRGLWLALEAWRDDPPEFVLLENVPRIANRGRPLLDQIHQLLTAYGYAVRETTHDCGELGGLAQSRKRFLLVARHTAKVPVSLYTPDRRPLRAVGDVLGRMPLPGHPVAGPMHRLPSLQWRTWVRLAFVEAGSDWRSLEKLAVENGSLRDYLLVPEAYGGSLGVQTWDQPTGTVAGESRPTNGAFSIADPRVEQSAEYGQLGVRRWQEPTGAVSGQSTPGGGRYAVADPRFDPAGNRHFNNVYRVVRWDRASPCVTAGGSRPTAGGLAVADPRTGWPESAHRNKLAVGDWTAAAPTVTGSTRPGSGAGCVADPRAPDGSYAGKYGVTPWTEATRTVIGGSTTGQGAFAVADPRAGLDRSRGDHYLTGGHYGVVPWAATAYAIAGAARHDNGHNSVADPRLPDAADRLVCVIRALDGTWHRPFTTLELAALQSLVDPEDVLELDGLSDSAWRERIGNAVPPEAAAAIAGVMGRALLGAWSGETFLLSSAPVWVRPTAVALSI